MTARILVLVSAACACLSTGTAAAATPADDAWQAAENLFASGEFPDAAEAYAGFRGRHADDPRATEAGLRQGEALFRAGRLDPALAEFASAARDPRARFRLGNVLYLLGRPAEAIPHLRGLLADSGTPPELEGPARYFLIRSLVSMGKTDEARRAMVGFVLRDDAAAAYTGLALGDIEAAGLGASVPDGRQAGEADPQQRSAAAEAAVAAYRDALPRAGEGRLRAETLLRMAEVQRRAGRTGEALENYRLAVESQPEGPVAPCARLGAAWAAFAAGDADQAAAEAVRARQSARDPALAREARYVEGTALVAAGSYAAACDALAGALGGEALDGLAEATFPRDRALYRLAWAADAAGRHELAARAAGKLAGMDVPPERLAQARFVAAEAALNAGRPAEALAGYEAAALGGKEIAALAAYRRGVALVAMGEPGKAAAAFDDFAAANPAHRLAAHAKALAARAYLGTHDLDRAARCFGEAVKVFEGTPLEAELVWGASIAEYMRGDFDAMAALDRRILADHASSPRAPEAAYWLAWSRLTRNDWEEAARLFREAAALDAARPELRAAALLEAASALERAGHRSQALEVARSLVTGPLAERAPVEACLWVAEVLREEGRPEEGREILDAALGRAGEGPERARLIYARGEIARVAGEPNRAIALYEDALRARPTPELAAAAKLGKARCLMAKGRRAEAEVVLENIIDGTTGWGRAAAYVERGRLSLEGAAALKAERRASLAERAARDFRYVALLFVPEGPGEGARLVASALVGSARADALLGRYDSARDRLQQLLDDPLLGTLPEAVDARKLLQEIGLRAAGAADGGTE